MNSTTIRFLWSPPPQQFINGINQGYKVHGLGPWVAVVVCHGLVTSEEAICPTVVGSP